MTWNFTLIILLLASCRPETLIFCQKDFNDNWWQIGIENKTAEKSLFDEYGDPLYFYFGTEQSKLFIHNEEEMVSIIDYSMIDDNIYDISEINTILTVEGKDPDENIWHLWIDYGLLAGEGTAAGCPIENLPIPL